VAKFDNGPTGKSFPDDECCHHYHNKYPDFTAFLVSFNTLALNAEQRHPTSWKRPKTEFLVISTQRSFHSFHATLAATKATFFGRTVSNLLRTQLLHPNPLEQAKAKSKFD
jgi:hypothetical protein